MTSPILPRHDLSAEEVEVIEDRLYDYNKSATGREDAEGLGFTIQNEAGEAVGAAIGYTWSGIAELKLLWVDETCRGRGHGRALLNAFIEEASHRGVNKIWVASHEFQAPELYEKAGFKRMAEFEGWPEGHRNVVLRKTLRD